MSYDRDTAAARRREAMADFKDDSRAQRLIMPRNQMKAAIEREWGKRALKICDDFVREYWVCRQDHGLMVIFRCRDEYKTMESCVQKHTRDEDAFEQFRQRRMAELEDRWESTTSKAAGER